MQKKINSLIITMGNELIKEEIVNFSKQLNLATLYDYIFSVYTGSNKFKKLFLIMT